MNSSETPNDDKSFLETLDAIDRFLDHEQGREFPPGTRSTRITDLFRHWHEVGCPDHEEWTQTRDYGRVQEIAAQREARRRPSGIFGP